MSTFLRPIVWSVVFAVAVSLCCAGSAPAEIVVHAEASHANHRTVEGPGGGTQNFSFGLLAGGGGGQNGFAGIAYFKLPDVLTADSLTDADLQFTLSLLGNSVLGNLDIYGLGYVTGTPSTSVPSSWYFDDANDTRTGNDLGTNIGTNTVTKIADNALLGGTSNPSPSVHSTNASQDATLATFLRSLYTAGATANDYAVIRFNVDDYVPHDGNQNRYNIGSVTSGPTPPSQAPVLTMTTDNPTLIDNTGITAIASSEWTNTTPHRLAIQAVNGAGLSGSEYTTATHSGTQENVWLSGYTAPSLSSGFASTSAMSTTWTRSKSGTTALPTGRSPRPTSTSPSHPSTTAATPAIPMTILKTGSSKLRIECSLRTPMVKTASTSSP